MHTPLLLVWHVYSRDLRGRN